jgi:hypothetical protein
MTEHQEPYNASTPGQAKMAIARAIVTIHSAMDSASGAMLFVDDPQLAAIMKSTILTLGNCADVLGSIKKMLKEGEE